MPILHTRSATSSTHVVNASCIQYSVSNRNHLWYNIQTSRTQSEPPPSGCVCQTTESAMLCTKRLLRRQTCRRPTCRKGLYYLRFAYGLLAPKAQNDTCHICQSRQCTSVWSMLVSFGETRGLCLLLAGQHASLLPAMCMQWLVSAACWCYPLNQ